MNNYADKTQKKNVSQSVANTVAHKKNYDVSNFQFVNNSPESIVQRKLQEMANNRPRTTQLKLFGTNKKIKTSYNFDSNHIIAGNSVSIAAAKQRGAGRPGKRNTLIAEEPLKNAFLDVEDDMKTKPNNSITRLNTDGFAKQSNKDLDSAFNCSSVDVKSKKSGKKIFVYHLNESEINIANDNDNFPPLGGS